MDFCNARTIFVLLFFQTWRPQKPFFPSMCLYSAKFFKSLWRLSWLKYRKSRIVLTLQNCTFFSLDIFLTSGSDIFNYRFTKTSQFSGYEVPTRSRKVPYTIVWVELYIPPKFHANRSTRLGEDGLWHINASHLRLDLGLIETIKINKFNELHSTRIFKMSRFWNFPTTKCRHFHNQQNLGESRQVSKMSTFW